MIKRDIYESIKNHLTAREITVLVGARQVGKTTLLKLLEKELKQSGSRTLFLNLDYEPHLSYVTSQQQLLAKIELEFGSEKGYVIIDEIQRKENAGIFLKGIYDLDVPYKFIVSGSGSLELKEKIQESLAGRKRLFEIYPVSFREFINYKTDYKYENKLASYFSIEKGARDRLFEEYINFGGYPRIIIEPLQDEKNQIINEIFRSYVERDIVYLLNIGRTDAFVNLVKILAADAGKLLNYASVASRLHISMQTLKKYIWYLEKTFVVNLMTPYHCNYKKEISKSPQVYFNDLGMLNYSRGTYGIVEAQQYHGFLFQNFVHGLLCDLIKDYSDKIYFWRTADKAEVDFILERAGEVIPVEVKHKRLNNTTVPRSLRSFIDKYSPKKAWIVNLDYEAVIKIGNSEVEFMPYYRLVELRDK